MSVRAPFTLQQIDNSLRSGQAQGAKWFLVPFRFASYALGSGFYLGFMSQYGGRETWRQR